jgi:hypothetical protein
MARLAIAFFGLDSSTPTTPPPTTPPPTTPPPTTPPPTTPPPTTPPPADGACRVTTTVNSWNTGLTAQVTIANTGGSAVNIYVRVFRYSATRTTYQLKVSY